MQKLQLAALAVIAAGGALAAPREAHATYKRAPMMYCCQYVDERLGPNRIESSCCHLGGCKVGPGGCTGLT